MTHLTAVERAVLDAFKSANDSDPVGSLAAYAFDVQKAAPGFGGAEAIAVCRDLRRRKLLHGEGRGTHAHYWIAEKGLAALGV